MPRQRMVKPDFFDSDSLAECCHSARLAFIGLWVMGDDKGNVKLSIRKLKKQIFPLDDVTDAEFQGWLAELERVGCIKVYEVDGEEYITSVNFSVYQTVKNPSKTNIPEPPEALKKKKRTTRFSTTNPALTQSYGSANSNGGTYGDSSGTTPVLPHDVPPNNKRNKEVDIFPKEKISTTSPVGAVAAKAAPPAEENNEARSPHCPMCDSLLRMTITNGEMRWVCNCIGTIKDESVVWR